MRFSSRGSWIRALLLLSAAVSLSCAGVAYRMPHLDHVSDPLMGCGMCHQPDGERMAFPDAERCAMCHEVGEQDAPAQKPRIPALSAEAVSHALERPKDLPEVFRDVTFSHPRHEKGGLACEDCHARVHDTDLIGKRSFPSMSECVSCHHEQGQPSECKTCHAEIGPEYRPVSHRERWEKRHGEASRADQERCELCHTSESECRSCHETQQPTSHHPMWKWKPHGLGAVNDREQCATCHRSDFCSRCHRTERPISHRAVSNWLWGDHQRKARFNMRSCLVCHSENQAFCSTCHALPPYPR